MTTMSHYRQHFLPFKRKEGLILSDSSMLIEQFFMSTIDGPGFQGSCLAVA